MKTKDEDKLNSFTTQQLAVNYNLHYWTSYVLRKKDHMKHGKMANDRVREENITYPSLPRTEYDRWKSQPTPQPIHNTDNMKVSTSQVFLYGKLFPS